MSEYDHIVVRIDGDEPLYAAYGPSWTSNPTEAWRFPMEEARAEAAGWPWPCEVRPAWWTGRVGDRPRSGTK